MDDTVENKVNDIHPIFQAMVFLGLVPSEGIPSTGSDTYNQYVLDHTGPFEATKKVFDGQVYTLGQIRPASPSHPIYKLQCANENGEWYLSVPLIMDSIPEGITPDGESYFPASKGTPYVKVWVAPKGTKKCGNCDKDHGLISIRYVQKDENAYESLSEHAYGFLTAYCGLTEQKN